MLEIRKIELKYAPDMSPELRESVEIYSKRLIERKLPVIISGKHFCQLIGVDSQYVFGVTNYANQYYRKFSIKSKRKYRCISEPLPLLKNIQSLILKKILYAYETNKCSKAYTPKLSIKSNARLHINQDVVFNCDVSNFFDNIKYRDVYSIFYSAGYTKEVSTILAKLCTLNGCLPQGAPTSGYLSNIFMQRFDDILLNFCLDNGYRYTRYSDDITISGKISNTKDIINTVEKNLKTIGLNLNPSKTRFSYKHNRQIVTGIVVNDKLSAGMNRRKKLRQELYYIDRYGFRGHFTKTRDASEEKMLERIIGDISYVLSIRKDDDLINKKKNILAIYRQHLGRLLENESI